MYGVCVFLKQTCQLDKHALAHLAADQKSLKCATCNSPFTSKGALFVFERIHEGVLLFQCKVGKKRFNQIPRAHSLHNNQHYCQYIATNATTNVNIN